MGIVALAHPQHVSSFFGIQLLSTDARNEFRAVYGGFGVAVAVLLCLAVYQASLKPGIIIAVLLALLGMALGRVLGALIERPGPWPVSPSPVPT